MTTGLLTVFVKGHNHRKSGDNQKFIINLGKIRGTIFLYGICLYKT